MNMNIHCFLCSSILPADLYFRMMLLSENNLSILAISSFLNIFWGIFSLFILYNIQHCRPSDSTVPTDAGIEPKTVATGALAVRRSNH